MSVDGALFGDDPVIPDPTEVEQPITSGIADWQVEQLRSALDAHGVQGMFERQRLIEGLAGRAVSSLRDLEYSEARVLLERLSTRRKSAQSGTTSSWDDREEDTWIDRL